MRRLAFAAAAVLFVLVLPACSMNKAVSGMSVELKKVHITNMDQFGFDATVYMQVNNPNWFGMTVSDVSYSAFVDGQQMAKGATDKELVIPADGSAMAELPLEVAYGSLKDRMYEILKGRLVYRVKGEVGFKTWLGRYSLPFDTEKKPEKDSSGDGAEEGG